MEDSEFGYRVKSKNLAGWTLAQFECCHSLQLELEGAQRVQISAK